MSEQTNNGAPPEGGSGDATPAAPAAAPRNGVINVSGQDWAIGLSWYSFGKEIFDAALSRILGKEHTFYVARRSIAGATGNVGVASPAMGHSAGQKVAATALAIWRGGNSWLAVYPLGGGLFWLVGAIRENIVEDTAALSESEARSLLKAMTTAEWSWETVYAPEGWDLGGLSLSEEALLRPSLTQDLRSSGSRALSLTTARALQRLAKRHGPWVLVVAIILVLVFAFDVPSRIADFNREEVVIAQQEIVVLPPVWDSAMVAGTWLLTCARNLQPLAYFVPGWSLRQITCDAESDRIVYEYIPASNEGTVVEQIEVIWNDITFEREMQLGDTGSFVVTPLGYAASGARGVVPEYGEGEVFAIYNEMSLLAVPIPRLSGVVETPEDRQLLPSENRVEVTPAASHVPLFMATSLTPKRWFETYGLAGMVMDRVTYTGESWAYEGRIYAKR